MVRKGKDIGVGGRLFGLSAPMLLLNGREGESSGRKTRDEVRKEEEEGIDWIIERGFGSWMGTFFPLFPPFFSLYIQ